MKKHRIVKFIVFLSILTVSTLFSTEQGLAWGNTFTITGDKKYTLQSHYEINDEYISGDYLYIEGFYFVSDLQNFVTTKGSNPTHAYEMTINGKTYENTSKYSIDMTDMEFRASKPWVTSSESAIAEPGQITKNYRYKDVGFQFKIPLKDFTSFSGLTKTYSMSMTLYCYNTIKGKKVEVPYKTNTIIGTSLSKSISYKGYTISFNGDLENSYGIISGESAYIRTTAGKTSSNIAKDSDGHNLYWTLNDVIYDFSKTSYNSDEKRTWYQAPYGAIWYDAPRYRARYRSTSKTKGWMASTYVSNVEGEKLSLKISNSAPTIKASNKTYNEGTLITNAMLLQSVTASDSQDGTITSKVTVSSRGSLASASTKAKAGTYTISYNVKDSNDVSTTVSVTVTVKNVAPVITASNKTYNEGTLITNAMLLQSVTASDVYDGTITSKVTVSSRGSLASASTKAKAGTYTISYNVKDSNNASTTVNATVTVKNIVPVITASNKTYDEGTLITNAMLLQSVTASDVYDGNITSKVIVSNRGKLPSESIGVSTGQYTVTYSVTDTNNATVTKSVQVLVNMVVPIITAEDIVIDEGTIITKDLLLDLSKAKANDLIDGDITSSIVINDLGGLILEHKARSGSYTVGLEVTNSKNASSYGTFEVIVNSVQYNIRYISKTYLHTLKASSKWSVDPLLNQRLVSTLNKSSSSSIQVWKFNKNDIKRIKDFEHGNDAVSENINSEFLSEFGYCRIR